MTGQIVTSQQSGAADQRDADNQGSLTCTMLTHDGGMIGPGDCSVDDLAREFAALDAATAEAFLDERIEEAVRQWRLQDATRWQKIKYKARWMRGLAHRASRRVSREQEGQG